jgi:hypothetical protein
MATSPKYKNTKNITSKLTNKRNVSIVLIAIIAAFGAWRVFLSGASPNNCQPEKSINICDIDQVQGNTDNILSNGPEAQDINKRDAANWPLYFGTAFRAPTASLDGAQPVYRVFNESVTWHDYLFDAGVRDKETKNPGKVKNEGIAFYAWPDGSRAGTVPVYRMTQGGGTTKVIFTTDKAWRDKIIAADTNNSDGWKDGGIPFYAFPPTYKAIATDGKPQANPYDCSIQENFVSERCATQRKNLEEAVANGTVGSTNECPETLEAYKKEVFPSRFTQACQDKWNAVLANPSTAPQQSNQQTQPGTSTTNTTGSTPGTAPAPSAAKIACDGDGTSGYRTQFIYLHYEGEPDRLAQKRTEIESMAVRTDQVVQNSAKKTGGIRKVRYVHTNNATDCRLDIQKITLSRSDQSAIVEYGSESLKKLMAKVKEKKFGLTLNERKYVVYVDHNLNTYQNTCGLGGLSVPTEQAEVDAFINKLRAKGAVINTQQDVNNLASTANPEFNMYENLPGIAVFPSGLTNRSWSVACNVPFLAPGEKEPTDAVTHELFHTFGAVGPSTPNGSKKGHCIDEYDVMCYQDEDRPLNFSACSDRASNWLLDCNGNDYFSTNPPAGSYLSNFWNIANSKFLIKS